MLEQIRGQVGGSEHSAAVGAERLDAFKQHGGVADGNCRIVGGHGTSRFGRACLSGVCHLDPIDVAVEAEGRFVVVVQRYR